MDKCREAFEQVDEIKDSLSENIVFIGNQYTTSNDGFYDLVNWLNGAWYSFQEQQKQVDELQARVDELESAFKHLIEMKNKSISYENDLFDKGWNQSSKQTLENIYRLTGLGEQALKGGED